MIRSTLDRRGPVTFPEFTGERVYMREFYMRDGLPSDLKRWQPTIDQMLAGIVTDEPVFLMIDQALVVPGTSHRRPGIHVDGYWNPGHGKHGHRARPAAHSGQGHNGSKEPEPSHSGRPGHAGRIRAGHSSDRWPSDAQWRSGPRHGPTPTPKHSSANSGWEVIDFSTPEAIILASDVGASAAYVGLYDEQLIGHGGDASAIDVVALDHFLLDANRVYAGNVALLHESLPVLQEVQRTLVRLNVPGWSP